jgi:hypothetical protein
MVRTKLLAFIGTKMLLIDVFEIALPTAPGVVVSMLTITTSRSSKIAPKIEHQCAARHSRDTLRALRARTQ